MAARKAVGGGIYSTLAPSPTRWAPGVTVRVKDVGVGGTGDAGAGNGESWSRGFLPPRFLDFGVVFLPLPLLSVDWDEECRSSLDFLGLLGLLLLLLDCNERS